MSNIIGLKINTTTASAKCIGIIRKYNPFSISEIKNLIANNDYVLSCDYTDDSRLPIIINCYNELSSANIPVELYEHNRKCTISFLNNLCSLYDDISRQIDEEMDDEDSE